MVRSTTRLALFLGLLAAPAVAFAEPDKMDVSHVKKGQVYHYLTVTETPQMTSNTEMTYHITEVKAGEYIKYDMTTITKIKFKNPGMPAQKPQKHTTKNIKIPLTGNKPKGAPPSVSPMVKDLGKETIKVSGVSFECRVVLTKNKYTGDVKSWTSMKYPFMIKTEKKGKPLMYLVKITTGGAPSADGGGATYSEAAVKAPVKLYFEVACKVQKVDRLDEVLDWPSIMKFMGQGGDPATFASQLKKELAAQPGPAFDPKILPTVMQNLKARKVDDSNAEILLKGKVIFKLKVFSGKWKIVVIPLG